MAITVVSRAAGKRGSRAIAESLCVDTVETERELEIVGRGPGSHYVKQAGLELRDPHASASWLRG